LQNATALFLWIKKGQIAQLVAPLMFSGTNGRF